MELVDAKGALRLGWGGYGFSWSGEFSSLTNNISFLC